VLSSSWGREWVTFLKVGSATRCWHLRREQEAEDAEGATDLDCLFRAHLLSISSHATNYQKIFTSDTKAWGSICCAMSQSSLRSVSVEALFTEWGWAMRGWVRGSLLKRARLFSFPIREATDSWVISITPYFHNTSTSPAFTYLVILRGLCVAVSQVWADGRAWEGS